MATTINVDDQHLVEGTMFGGFPVSPRATPSAPVIPGTDIAGVVDAVGSRVRHLSKGDRVFGIVSPSRRFRSWADFCVVNGRNLHLIPDGLTFEQAASLGLAGMVVCSLVGAAGDVRGKRCLVIGASGGIGSLTTAVLTQAGADVWGVASAANTERVLGQGARGVIDYRQGPFGKQLRARGLPFDHAFDCLGGRETESQALAVLDRRGAFLTICGPERYVGERRLSFFQLAAMLGYIFRRSLLSTFRGPRYRLVGPMAPDWAAIERLLLGPGIVPPIDRVVPFDRRAMSEAIAYVGSHRAHGKVVIALDALSDAKAVG